MAERSVSVHLKAVVDGFRRSMGQARDAVKGVGDESEKTSSRASSSLGKLAEHARKNEQAYTQVGGALVGIGAAAAAGVGLAVAKFADFDEAMSAVQAATHETTENMGLLRAAAIDAGAATQYSATEAAGAIEEMAKAGVSTTDILGGGLTGALALAAAGTMDVGEAAETAATAMTMFGLSGRDIPHIADLLAAGAGKAQGSVSDMGMALKQAGLVADQTGLSIEETTGGLAAFAKAGLVGSDAGTSFKAMLQRLTPQSKEAAELMDELGISAYDSQGQFIGLAEFAGNLKQALADLTPEQRNSAMATIFGSDAVRAASVLYEQGESGIRDWTKAVDDAGFAAETARLKTDNLKGDVERLGGSLDTALIQTGTSANGVLRDMVGQLTGLIDIYNDAPPAAQGAALAVGAVTAGVSLLGGGAVIAVPRVVELYDALGKMGARGVKAQGQLAKLGRFLTGPWGLAVGASIAVLGLMADGYVRAKRRVDGLTASLDKHTGAVTRDTKATLIQQRLTGPQVENARKLGLELDVVADAMLNKAAAVEEFNAAIERGLAAGEGAGSNPFTGQSGSEEANAAKALRDQVAAARAEVERSKEEFDEHAEAMGADAEASEDAADAQGVLKESVGVAAQTTEDAKDAVEALATALAELNGAGRSAIDSQIAWEASLDEATEALEKNGATLDLSTDAGRENMTTLQNMASDAEKLADSILRETGSEEQMRASLAASREALYQTARRFGMTEEEARAYVDRVLSVPVAAKTSVELEGAQQAIEELNAYLRKLDDIDGSTATTYIRHIERLVRTGPRTAQADGGILAFADGGTMPAIGAQQPQIQPNHGPGGIMWAETGAGPWEAFISGHPAKHDRSVRIWEETGERLGLRFQRFDSGGYYGTAAAAPSRRSGPDVVSLSNTDIWKLADAVSRVQLSLNGRAIAENTQSRQDFMMRAGG